MRLPHVRNLWTSTHLRDTFLRTTIALFLSGITFYYLFLRENAKPWTPSVPGPGNSTLGFGKIFVVTENVNTWRIQGLKAVADHLDIDLTIPVQERPSDDAVRDYVAGAELTNHLDAVRATMNYAKLLEIFLATDVETALFMEDDVDFGIKIKQQLRLFSESVLGDSSGIAPNSERPNSYPYGKDLWDVLWLGHYGMEFTTESRIITYHDPYALQWSRMTSTFNNYYAQQADDAPQQIISSVAPLSTFAFALTRKHAKTLLDKIRNDRPQTMDVELHIGCKGLEQKCLAPVPELMHHHKVLGQSSLGHVGVQDDVVHDLAWWKARHKYTYNVNASARCNVAQTGEKVGDVWQCLPDQDDRII